MTPALMVITALAFLTLAVVCSLALAVLDDHDPTEHVARRLADALRAWRAGPTNARLYAGRMTHDHAEEARWN